MWFAFARSARLYRAMGTRGHATRATPVAGPAAPHGLSRALEWLRTANDSPQKLPAVVKNCLDEVSVRRPPKTRAMTPAAPIDKLVAAHSVKLSATCARSGELLRRLYAQVEDNTLCETRSLDGRALALLRCTRKNPRFIWMQQSGKGLPAATNLPSRRA